MAQNGGIDAGCGRFWYQIISTQVPLEAFSRHCFDAGEFGDHDDIQPAGVKDGISWACVGSAIQPIKRRDESTYRHISSVFGSVRYEHNIYWKDGCSLKDTDEVYPNNPLRVQDSGRSMCIDTLWDNYKQCNNGGIGGRIQIGCLVYQFKGTKA